jgi:Reverse transcriptase (RNA-dependent DNA polymerase)
MNFVDRKSWKKVLRKDFKGRKPLKTGYVFKYKDEEDIDLSAKTRIVIKGYTEIPGVDYTEKFAPVATSTTVLHFFCWTFDGRLLNNHGRNAAAATTRSRAD